MKKIVVAFLFFYQAGIAQKKAEELNLIPQPVSVQMGSGEFALVKETVIVAADGEDKKNADYLNGYLQEMYGFKFRVSPQEAKNAIRLHTKRFIKAPDKDAYTLAVTKDGVNIEGDTYAGTFYGIQTLLQLLPTVNNKGQIPGFAIPFVTVSDYPRFAYRGMHLDVSRHFFPPAYVKKYIDYIALHKMNYFHWHLTDDQGWRIEIKKYPELTTKGAYRNGTIVGRYPGSKNDNLPYGGFYTKAEVKEIVQYAADRHITVVPEIEMPGHASAAIAAYPGLSCFPEEPTKIPSHPSGVSTLRQSQGDKKQVQETWGVFNDVFCAGNDSTFTFLQGVMDEILPLFPSKFIHVGGDECPKTNWKRCPRCQDRIKTLGLKDEHGLQSYFIQRMETYINGKGRTIIGWDEILEGGLAPNAVVMSWRGEQGGIEAARQGHNVIMTPGKPVYFDYSQTKNEDSVTIGGYNSLEAVYGYEPVPKELNAADAGYILGAQANLWTEYIAYPSKVEYMIFPRLSALSEVLWSPKEIKNWKGFERRLPVQFQRYKLWKSAYSQAYYDLQGQIKNTPGNKLSWVIVPNEKKSTIKFTYPDNRSTYITGDSLKVDLTNSGTYTARQVTRKPPKNGDDAFIGGPIKINYILNKAVGKKVTITAMPNGKYPGQGGAFSLVNGVYSNNGLSYPDWLGWIADDLEATIDLGKTERIDSVRMHTLDQNGSWIYLPSSVEVMTSGDGKTFSPAGKSSSFMSDTLTMGWITVPLQNSSSRYLKLIAKNYGLIPDGQPGGGNKAWLFADEIQVY